MTEVDQIGLLNIYHFYCLFRAHISNFYFLFSIFLKLKTKYFSPNKINFILSNPKIKKKLADHKKIAYKKKKKKKQFKTQLVQNGLKGTEIEWVDLIGLNGIEVDLIGSNSNCLIIGRKNYLQQILENTLYIILQLQNNYLFLCVT